MTDEKKKPVKTKINFSAEALERLEQSKKHLEESKKRQTKENKQARITEQLQTSKTITKLWQWLLNEVKKLPNFPNTTDEDYSKWVKQMLDKADDSDEWYVMNEFNNLMPQAVHKLYEAKDEVVDINNKPEKFALWFLEELADWKQQRYDSM